MILGLDASTSVCGWCILFSDGTFCDAGAIEFDKAEDLYQKLFVFRRHVAALQDQYDIANVFIEAPALMFASKSTAHVMSLLQRWNGMVSAILAIDWNDKGPISLSAASARATVGLKVKRKQNVKQSVVEFIRTNSLAPEAIWLYKRTGKLKDHCFDIADALIVARAGYLRGSDQSPKRCTRPTHVSGEGNLI